MQAAVIKEPLRRDAIHAYAERGAATFASLRAFDKHAIVTPLNRFRHTLYSVATLRSRGAVVHFHRSRHDSDGFRHSM